MQQHAGPTRPKQYGLFARGGLHAFQIDHCLADGLVDCAHPVPLVEQVVVEIAAAEAEAAGFAAAVDFGHDADVEPHQRADVAGGKAVGTDDVDRAPAARKTGADLRDTRILGACHRVDFLEQRDLLGEGHEVERARIGIEVPVCTLGRGRMGRRGRIEQLQRLARARDGRGADFIGMGKARGLARDTAQAEARIAAVIGGLEPSVVKGEALARHELQVQFAIVAGAQQARRQRLGFLGIELGVEQGVRIVCWRHAQLCRDCVVPAKAGFANPVAMLPGDPDLRREDGHG